MFKKYFLLFLILFVCCTFIGCNTTPADNSTEQKPTESTYVVNNFEDATISNISISENAATLEFSYSGENQLHLAEWFVLEVYDNGTWYTLPYDIENSWELEAYPVEPNQSRSMEYNWKYVYEPLSAGKYRIVTKVTDFKESTFANERNEYYLAKEFIIE